MVNFGITSPDHVTLLIRQSRRGGIASGQRDVSFQSPELRRIGLTQFRNHPIGNLLRLIVVAECEMKIGELLRPHRLEWLYLPCPLQFLESPFPITAIDCSLSELRKDRCVIRRESLGGFPFFQPALFVSKPVIGASTLLERQRVIVRAEDQVALS